MIRKLSLILIMAIAAISVCQAGLATGTWKQHPVFGAKVQQLLDTPDKVYFTSSGVLHGYDKKTQESRSYCDGTLSDYNITKLYYNFDDKYLLIIYDNANLDILLDDGTVMNMPDIKDMSLDGTKTINDIDFYDGKIYVACSFGLVIYDGKKGQVIKSGLYGKQVNGAMATPNYLYIAYDNYGIYRTPIDHRISNFSDFSKVSGISGYITQMVPLDREAEIMVFNTKKNGTFIRNYKGSNRLTIGKDQAYHPRDGFFMTKAGVTFVDSPGIYTVSADGTITKIGKMDGTVAPQMIGCYEGLKSLWAADGDGLANYDITTTPVTVLSDKSRVTNATTASRVCKLTPVPGEASFLICNHGISDILPGAVGSGNSVVMAADKYTNGQIKNIDLKEGGTHNFVNAKSWLKSQGYTDGVISPSFVIADPDDTDLYYMGSTFDGLFAVKDGKEVVNFYGCPNQGTSGHETHKNNLAANDWWGTKIFAGAFDKQGNLWVDSWGGPAVVILPAAKRKNLANVKREDWLTVVDDYGSTDVQILPCAKSDMVFVVMSCYGGPLYAFDTHGNYTSPSQFTRMEWTRFTDQDGKIVAPDYRYAAVEDKDGKVWFSTSEGILEFANPKDAVNPTATVNHIKVPRQDGSGLADYLLASEKATSISVDGSNRKWISTASSGVYLVSPRGDEILLHFTKDNSPLPSNEVNCVYADPYSNSVFIGTNSGMFEYSSDSAPAADNFDDVYAYPNPVTPDYGGWITIKNLMDNSLVKICDAQMNVVSQTRSEGGIALWDGCNLNGERVKSGVYYVVASSGNGDSTSKSGKVATKILVVN